ncbi:hypothetical protein ACHAXR_010257 [Thalassiosira sp. AJA248-18]
MSSKRPRSSSLGSGTSRRRLRGSDPMTIDDGTVCSNCNENIPFLSKYAQLNPCRCNICLKYLASLNAQRGKQLLKCCEMNVSSHQIVGAEQFPEGDPVPYNIQGQNDNDFKINQPLDYLLKKEYNSFVESGSEDGMIAVLYCGMLERQSGRMNTTPHAKIVKLMPRELFDHAVQNCTPLMAALHGLATGEPERNLDKILGQDQADYQSQYLAIAAARDLILRCTNRYPHNLQLMIGDQMEMQSCSSLFKELLSAFRVCYSKDYSDKAQCEAVVKQLTEGIEVGANDLCLLNGDNIGFTILGKNASYNQWILFQDIIIRLERLRELKIHRDDVSERLSREPAHDWLELVEADHDNTLAAEIVTPTDADYETLTHCVCEGIHYAIDLVVNDAIKVDGHILRVGKIIELEDAKNEPTNNQNMTTDAVLREMPRMATPREDGDINNRQSDGGHYPAGLNHCWYNEYTESNGYPPPMDIDTQELPPAYIGAFFMCDGQPAANLSSVIAADNMHFYSGQRAETDAFDLEELFPHHDSQNKGIPFDKWLDAIDKRVGFLGSGSGKSVLNGKFMAFPGGFHAGMKLHNCCGIMFGNYVKHFFAAWRDTLAKVYWILFPSDPRQLENELPQYILEHYRSAFLFLWESWGNDKSNIPSAKDVHQYMIDRAKDCPYRQACLIELRYIEITKLLRNAAKVGKRGSAELFMTAVKFSLTLWATIHAVDYVRLGCDLLQFWKCASPALKILYENEIFTGLTSQGTSLPRDECMEWSVKHTRKHNGKVERKGMQKNLEKSVSTIPSQRSDNLVRQELRTGNADGAKGTRRTRDWLSADSPIILLHDLLHIKMKFWHPTNQPIIGDYLKEKPIYAEPNSFKLPGNESLHYEVFLCFDIGLERVIKYMQRYYIDFPFSVGRSEKEVSLAKIMASSIDRKQESKKTIDREISTSKDDLKAAFNKNEVGKKLQLLANELNEDIDDPDLAYVVRLNKLNKDDRIQKLIKMRKFYFRKDTSAMGRLEAAARKAFEEKYPSESSGIVTGEVILAKKIYCLSENVLQLDRYKSYV